MNDTKFLKWVRKTKGCWIWTGNTSRGVDGYGSFKFRGSIWQSHRVAWTLWQGEIPDDKKVLHKCDVPACVNPDHLFTGTILDNNLDKARKGRAAMKLTKNEVLKIRANTNSTQYELAKEFNVDKSTISDIKSRKLWKHV